MQKKLSTLLGILFLSQTVSGFVGGDVMARWWNNQAVKLYEEQAWGEAIDRLESAKEYAAGTTQTVLNNLGSLEYEQGKYSSAIEEWESAVVECDIATPEEECARGYYNLGNSRYRMGEQAEGDEQRQQWEQAIADYETALEHNPNDTQAQENIEFIQQKLVEQENEESDSQDQASGDSGESGEENQSKSENQNGEGKEGASSEESTQTSQESSGSDTEEAEQQSESRPQPQASARAQQQQPLSSQQQAQLEQYMQQMDANQQRMGQYFRQSPDQQQMPENQNPFGGLFNDPFFSSFFGDQLGTQQFRESNNTGQPDW